MSYDPSPQETGAFSHLFSVATKGKGGSIGGKDAVTFFLTSQIPVPVLKHVWSIATNGQPEMQLKEFNTAMRLIALAQKGVTIGPQTLEQTRGMQVPLPTFQGVDMPKMIAPPPLSGIQQSQQQQQQAPPNWIISNESKTHYSKLWDSLEKTPQGLVEGKVAATFFAKSGHSREILRSIWQLSDINADGKLDKMEFFIGMHLTMMVKKCFTLPSTVPAELMQSVKSESDAADVLYPDLSNAAPLASASKAATNAVSTPPQLTSGGSNRLISQLAETGSQLRMETDRLKEFDGDLVRIRAELADLRANIEAKTASVTNQQMLAAQKISELRNLVKSRVTGGTPPSNQQKFDYGFQSTGGSHPASSANAFDGL